MQGAWSLTSRRRSCRRRSYPSRRPALGDRCEAVRDVRELGRRMVTRLTSQASGGGHRGAERPARESAAPSAQSHAERGERGEIRILTAIGLEFTLTLFGRSGTRLTSLTVPSLSWAGAGSPVLRAFSSALRGGANTRSQVLWVVPGRGSDFRRGSRA